MRAVTAAEMRRIEEGAIARGVPVEELMGRAGGAVADHVGDVLGGQIAQRRILVLAGPGKNGGDGLIAARILRQRGAIVSVACPIPRADDPLLERCAAAGCSITQGDLADLDATPAKAELVVDALLGTGHSRAIEGAMLESLNLVHGAENKPTVVSVDVPSGLDSDTGEVDPATLPADVTVALGNTKIGCLTVKGAEYCGAIHAVEIGLGGDADDGGGVHVLTAGDIQGLLPERRATSNKGTFGHSLIVGGSEAYRGAPALAARAAARAGAGTVAIAAPETITDSLAPMAPEATHIPLPQTNQGGLKSPQSAQRLSRTFSERRTAAIAIGPGMGQSKRVSNFLSELLDGIPADTPVVFDADALTILSQMPEWWTRLRGPVVVTPHPGEMARLCGISVEDVQLAREGVAAEKAKEWGVTIVLKGAYTIITGPDQETAICPLTMPALASGGTGDALAGIVTGFLSQGLTNYAAAQAGVYVHGTAAALAAQDNGNMTSGLLASDLIEKIPAAMGLIARGEGPVPPLFA